MSERTWDRRDDEGEIEYAAFAAYRDGPRPRVMERAASAVRRGLGTIVDFSQRFEWEKRVRDLDNHLDRVIEEERLEMLRTQNAVWCMVQMEALRGAMEVVEKEIAKLADAARESEGTVMRQRDLINLMERSIVLDQRLRAVARGESFWPSAAPAMAASNGRALDFSRLKTRELWALRRLLGKCGYVLE